MEKYNQFNELYYPLLEGFGNQTLTERYCLGTGSKPDMYKRVNKINKSKDKSNCENCWCNKINKFNISKNEDWKKMDNKKKYLFCKNGSLINKDIKNVIDQVNSKIEKCNEISVLKKQLKKSYEEEKMIEKIALDNTNLNEISSSESKKIEVILKKISDLKEKQAHLDKEILSKKKIIEKLIQNTVDSFKKEEEENLINEKNEIEKENKKDIKKMRNKISNKIDKANNLKLKQQEKTFEIIRLKEKIEDDIDEVEKLKKSYLENKENLSSAETLLNKCEDENSKVLVCPNYNYLFFSIIGLMIIYIVFVSIKFYNQLFVF